MYSKYPIRLTRHMTITIGGDNSSGIPGLGTTRCHTIPWLAPESINDGAYFYQLLNKISVIWCNLSYDTVTLVDSFHLVMKWQFETCDVCTFFNLTCFDYCYYIVAVQQFQICQPRSFTQLCCPDSGQQTRILACFKLRCAAPRGGQNLFGHSSQQS